MSEENRSRARQRLDEAAGFLDAYRLEAGVEPVPPVTEVARGAAESSLRAALDAARERIEKLSAQVAAAAAVAVELEAARAEAARLARELSARPQPGATEAARAAAEESARKARQGLEARCASLEERLTLMGAERVRVEALRRKAEQAAAEAEAGRRAMEDALRRELRVAHAAIDRAAAETGTREAAAAALRRELETLRLFSEEREAGLRGRLEATEKALAAARLKIGPPPPPEEPQLLEDELELPELPDLVAATLEPELNPGWARLLGLVRPSVEAAYGHLRRLHGSPLKPGARSLVRLAAACIGHAADSIASIELALSEAPAPSDPIDALPLVESALAVWEPALRKRGVTLLREMRAGAPKVFAEPRALRVLLFHVLRNGLEVLPKGARLTVKTSKTPEGALSVEFADDGPGFPAAWLERRFEPFASPRKGRAGLGLSIVRRTLRRWGGEAQAANDPEGRGARLVLTFASPLPPGPELI